MNKNVSLMAVLVVALVVGLAPAGTAQAAPFGQMRLSGNYSPHFTCVPGTVLNTQTRLGNLNGSLASSQAIRSIGAIRTPRIPVVDRITGIAPPLVTVDSTRYLRSVDGLARRPLNISFPTFTGADAVRALTDSSGNNNNGNGNGNGNGGGGSGGDGNDGGGDDENGGGKKGGGKGSSGAGGNGSGPGYSPPEPPDLDYFYYVDDDDDDERKRIVWMQPIIQMYKSQFGMYKSQFGGIRRIMGLGGTGFSAP